MNVNKQLPFLLSCLSAIGTIAVGVSAAKLTPEYMQLLDEIKKERAVNELSSKDYISVAFKHYTPTIIIGLCTFIAIFSSNVISKKQQTNLLSAYIMLNRSYEKYKNKIKQLYGNEINEKIEKEILYEEYIENDIECKLIYNNEYETMLFYEKHYGKCFERRMIDVLKAEYFINKKLVDNGNVVLNEFFDCLNLPKDEKIDWIDDVIYDPYEPLWVDFKHELMELDDGLECYNINIKIRPIVCSDLPF